MKKGLALSAMVFLALIAALAYFKQEDFIKDSPESVVKGFYQNWTDYEGNPLADEAYKSFPDITENCKTWISKIREGFADGGYDPVLCAQDKPQSWKISDVFIEDDMARVVVSEDFYGTLQEVEVLLKRENGWKIERIFCPADGAENAGDDSLNADEQDLVGDYIRENISSLSPESEVLGGKFYVTSVRFADSEKAEVEYEDGHQAFKAEALFKIEKGEVNITSFRVIEPQGKEADFRKTGNLVLKDGSLEFIYEEPGKPALGIRAVFNSQSSCRYSDGKNFDCGVFDWKNGDRIEVSGTKEGEILQISTLKLISRG